MTGIALSSANNMAVQGQVTARAVAAGVTFPGTCGVAVVLDGNGQLTTRVNNSGSWTSGATATSRLPDYWGGSATLSGIGALYDALLHVNSGTSPDGSSSSVDTWINLGATAWGFDRSSLGTTSGSWLISIRPRGGGATIASAVFTMSAVVSSP